MFKDRFGKAEGEDEVIRDFTPPTHYIVTIESEHSETDEPLDIEFTVPAAYYGSFVAVLAMNGSVFRSEPVVGTLEVDV